MFRKAGVLRRSAYIDDVICMGDTFNECQTCLDTILRLNADLGFGLRASKIKTPTTDISYLAIRIRTELSMLSIDPDMCSRVRSDVNSLRASPCITCLAFNSLCGSLSWIAQIMHGARTRMRSLWDALRSHPSGQVSELPSSIIHSLGWWSDRLSDKLWTGSCIWFSECTLPLIMMKLDASGTIAWGYHIGNHKEMCAWIED